MPRRPNRALKRVHNLPGPNAAQPINVNLVVQFGKRLAKRRAELSMTQLAMINRLNYLSGGEWGRSSASVWENGHAPPDFITIAYLARVLKTRPEYLAYGVRVPPRIEVPVPGDVPRFSYDRVPPMPPRLGTGKRVPFPGNGSTAPVRPGRRFYGRRSV